MSPAPLVLADRDGATAILVLNRPEKRNAMSDEMLHVFNAELERAIADDNVRTIVVTGSGDCFTSGRDRNDVGTSSSRPVSLEDMTVERSVELFTDTLRRLIASPKPTIAAVRGYAFGGGQAMALACDFLVAESTARFANIEMTYGFPAALNSVLLMRQLGRRRALEIAMTGDILTAEAWHQYGLVNRLADPGHLESVVREFVGVLNDREPWAVRRTKALMLAAEDVPLEAALTLGGQLNQLLRLNAERSRIYEDGDAARSRIQAELRRR